MLSLMGLRRVVCGCVYVSLRSALLVVSAHYESSREVEFVGDDGGHPGLLYDYTNFPPATYELQWPAIGAPSELAVQVRDALAVNGVPVSKGNNNARGYDHGVFIPLKLVFPEGKIIDRERERLSVVV